MKKWTVFLVAVVLSMVSANAQAVDWLIESRYAIPRMNELYNNSLGGHVQAQHWINHQFGVGFSGGLERYRTDVDSEVINGVKFDIEGANDYYPLGVHALWRFQSGKPFARYNPLTGKYDGTRTTYKKGDWIVSAGVVYLMADSGSAVTWQAAGATGEFGVDLDDTYAIEVGVLYKHPLGDRISLVAGVGARRNIGPARIRVPEIGLKTKNDMTAGFIRLGLLFKTY